MKILIYTEQIRDGSDVRQVSPSATTGLIVPNSVKRSDVTGNRFEWELGENKVI